jgi:hypothetical protein
LFSIFNEIFPNQKIGVIIFGSVQFLPKKSKLIFKKKTKTEPKLVQNDRFQFGLVILEQKPKTNQLAWFFLFGLIFSV